MTTEERAKDPLLRTGPSLEEDQFVLREEDMTERPHQARRAKAPSGQPNKTLVIAGAAIAAAAVLGIGAIVLFSGSDDPIVESVAQDTKPAAPDLKTATPPVEKTPIAKKEPAKKTTPPEPKKPEPAKVKKAPPPKAKAPVVAKRKKKRRKKKKDKALDSAMDRLLQGGE